MPIQKGQRISVTTEFKKGQSSRSMPVGTVTIRTDKEGKPRAWRKIAEPHTWMPRAQYVWQQQYGAIPDGYILHHKDEKTLHDTLNNLELVSRRTHLLLHRDEMNARRPPVTHIKSKTCSQCGGTWQGRGRRKALCPVCKDAAVRTSKQTYRLAHNTRKLREQYAVRRFDEGEIWLIQRLLSADICTYRSIARMFLTAHTTINYYAHKLRSQSLF